MARSSHTIRDLNDRFRRGDTTIPGQVMVTRGVQALVAGPEDEDTNRVLAAVRQFDTFNADNDPHGEHDFGAFEFLGEKLFWKLDYYAPDMQHGSEDPADIAQTIRILTIMLAEEY
ncbi:DUF3768 domain-containing protein [Hoeflea sp. AS60]|uniref:DUF3768 domain-containing protein n=1 Tax=Hoeflea sp. AS60 TaxID=3135780 RepID=UPI003179278C